ncbi:fumarylacetoacetate hydrolase family protein [Oligella urethralis]|uniref:2-keto-4-pentenoate hydratase/2-oxohepta-3-ene-1,7-dioic acid hydratase (Catechol pathway) n=1 Tax=Oligella urethralis TaxID=90245 RepID=A0A2X1UKV7_9BURK|nr:fumarylacetoacetate hydrolase family protein [Oligella urethralis]SPY07806.1 2-keto-4-pentenoate hydratase/2-oxohepta-3-ene-1,7-dioic acid hydratase (catechol pathway) [Oligella urethralis]
MSYVVEVAERVAVPVVGEEAKYPVRRVYCVGRNYASHAREMGADPDKEPPFFFSKANDQESFVIAKEGTIATIQYPSKTSNLHYEFELVVAIGKQGKNIPVAQAEDYIYGFAAGLDMTRRDLQNDFKKGGKPWEMAKAFDQAAVIGEISPKALAGSKNAGKIELQLNGDTVQEADLNELIWNLSEVISRLSEYVELHPGDLIYTGTPEGVGAVKPGDVMVGSIEGLKSIQVKVL